MRLILHVDLDGFYAQVEEHRHPELAGRPLAVQQWQGLIAINYVAKNAGVTRFMNIAEAQRKCPDLALVHVDIVHDKVSLEPYRAASRDIHAAIERFGVCEKAGLDEAFLDVTKIAMARRAKRQANRASLGDTTSASDIDVRLLSVDELITSPFLLDLVHTSKYLTEAAFNYSNPKTRYKEVCRSTSSSQPSTFSTLMSQATATTAPSFTSVTIAAEPCSTPKGDTTPDQSSDPHPSEVFIGCLASTRVIRGNTVVLLGDRWKPHTKEDELLFEAAVVSAHLRFSIYSELGYQVSSGISTTKLASKMASGHKKPAHQTLVPPASMNVFMTEMPLDKVPLFHRKMGSRLKRLFKRLHPEKFYDKDFVVHVKHCLSLNVAELETEFGTETALWVHRYLRGQDDRIVQPKGPPRSLLEAKALSKTIADPEEVRSWLMKLSLGLAERILDDKQRHRRWPKSITVQFHIPSTPKDVSRSCGHVRPVPFSVVRQALGDGEDTPATRRTTEIQCLADSLCTTAFTTLKKETATSRFAFSRLALFAIYSMDKQMAAAAAEVRSGRQRDISSFTQAMTTQEAQDSLTNSLVSSSSSSSVLSSTTPSTTLVAVSTGVKPTEAPLASAITLSSAEMSHVTTTSATTAAQRLKKGRDKGGGSCNGTLLSFCTKGSTSLPVEAQAPVVKAQQTKRQNVRDLILRSQSSQSSKQDKAASKRTPCPVCGQLIAVALADAHVNHHFSTNSTSESASPAIDQHDAASTSTLPDQSTLFAHFQRKASSVSTQTRTSAPTLNRTKATAVKQKYSLAAFTAMQQHDLESGKCEPHQQPQAKRPSCRALATVDGEAFATIANDGVQGDVLFSSATEDDDDDIVIVREVKGGVQAPFCKQPKWN
eukprot:m.303348 g.303348  ORF g.303348 m.303348 type:complete len:882 (+) comp15892_c1_seq13:69-2714(+)